MINCYVTKYQYPCLLVSVKVEYWLNSRLWMVMPIKDHHGGFSWNLFDVHHKAVYGNL